MKNGNLTNQDHKDMDNMLRRVLQAYKAGELTEVAVVSSLAHIIAAVDIENTAEARNWFRQQGVEFFKETDRISGRV
jgi:hypothetical protein